MTLIDKAEALAPCPFCGGEATFSEGKTGDGKPWHYVECTDCEAMGPGVSYADHNIAVKSALADAWNRRAIPARGVGVRALEWPTEPRHNGIYRTRHNGTGIYYMMRVHAQNRVSWRCSEVFGWNDAGSEDAAKASAQADYEARILAALAPTDATQAREAALRQMLVQMVDDPEYWTPYAKALLSEART